MEFAVRRIMPTLLSLLALAACRAGADATGLKCTQVPDTCTVNSDWAVWSDLPAAQLHPNDGFHPSGASDLGGSVILAWNKHSVFVIARVIDDHFNPTDSVSGFWNGDSIQFAFARTDVDGPGEGEALSVGAADFPFGAKVVVVSGTRGLTPGVRPIPLRVTHEGQTVTYVVAVPWRYMPAIDPLFDDGLRANVIVNDNDGSGRRGWLQLSTGIGDGLDATKFPVAAISRSPASGPLVHAAVSRFTADAGEPVDVSATVRGAVRGMRVRVSAGKWTAEAEVEANQGVARLTFPVKPEAFGLIGDAAVSAKLVDWSGREVGASETAVTVTDRRAASRTIEQARAALAEVDSLLQGQPPVGGNGDYVRLRANCLRYGLRVADLVQPRLAAGKDNGGMLEGAYRNIVSYADAAADALLADARALLGNHGPRQLTIRRPDFHAPWTVRNGSIYAGSEPVMLNGVCWMYGGKDSSLPLRDVGMNAQSVDMGPNSILGDGLEIRKDLDQCDPVLFWRRVVGEGQGWGEVFDLHTSPHYTPAWFKADDHYAWMNTADGRRLLELTYQGLAASLAGMKALKTADLANEWTYWSTSPEAMDGFRKWLKAGYVSVAKLNKTWRTSLRSFEEIPSPFPSADAGDPAARKGVYQPLNPEGIYRQRGPYWDWCRYNTTQAASTVGWMHAAVKKSFPHLLTHIKCVLSSREYRTLADNYLLGIDPEKVLPITDLIGTDASYIRGSAWKGTLFAYDYLKSIRPDSPIICTEMHAPPYGDAEAPGEIRRGLFQRFVHGERYNLLFLMVTSGVLDWWAQGFEGTNMSTWNIGACPAVLESLATTSADLQRLAKEISLFDRRKPDVLIYYDNAADFGIPQSDAPQGRYGDRAVKAYESLVCRDVRKGFVTESMLSQAIPTAPVIVMAGAEYASDRTVKALSEYVARGGVLVWLDDNLKYDHYGAPRTLGAWTRSRRVVRIPLPGDASAWEKVWMRVFPSAGVRVPVTLRGPDCGPVTGVETRSVRRADGQWLVFLANTNPSPARLRMVAQTGLPQHCFDLVSGQRVESSAISMAGNQVMLLAGESGSSRSR